jgi:hypothetical protein
VPRLDLSELQNELLRSGVSPRHIRRTLGELRDHYDDLVDHAIADGAGYATAQERALAELGDLHDVAVAIRSQPALRSWAYRFPYLALIVYPLTCLALLPAIPVLVGVAHAAHLARWAACIFLSGVVTAAIFLFMQLTIALT